MKVTEKIIKAVRGMDLIMSENGLPEPIGCTLEFGELPRSEVEMIAREYDTLLHYPTAMIPEIWTEIQVGRIKVQLATKKYEVTETWSAA